MARPQSLLQTEDVLLRLSGTLNRLPPSVQQIIAFGFRLAPYLILGLALWFSIRSYWGILPGIFQDEYVYSMGARKIPLSEQPYPNYLFAAIFQTVNYCGVEFYQCAKALNSAFLVGFVWLVYAISRQIHTRNVSLLIAAVAAVSPVTLFASFFMPEMMFFTLNLLAVFVLLTSGGRRYLPWIALSVILAAALLTKRHELFLLPGFALAAFVLLRNRGTSALKAFLVAIVFAVGLPVLLRQVSVFVLTGNPFPPLLGSTYADSFQNSLAGVDGESNDAPFSIFNLLSQGAWHFVFHISVLIIFGLALLRAGKPPSEASPVRGKDGRSMRHRLSVISLSLVASVLPAVVFFETYLTIIGDNHSYRLLGRYYEFVYVLLLVASVASASDWSRRPKDRLWKFATPLGFGVFLMVIGPFIETGPADSMIIHGLKVIGPWILLFLLGYLIALFVLAKSPGAASIVISVLVPALMVSTGFVARADVEKRIGTSVSSVDRAGMFIADSIPEARGEQILVIGRSRVEVTATKFWIDEPGVRHSIQPEGPREISGKKLRGIDYIVTLYPTALVTTIDVELLFESPGFRVFIVNKP